MVCAVAQGTKELVVGNERHVYEAGHFIVNSVQVPAAGRTLVASPECPCLWLSIAIDPAIVASVVENLRFDDALPEAPLRTVGASKMDLPIVRAVLKLAWLFDDGGASTYLLELALRELVYRLLATDQVHRVRQIVAHEGGSPQIVHAIRWVREHFAEPLSVDRLARDHGMSPSVLHLRFKQVTALSPLRFQKQLRLQAAQRLIASEGMSAAEAGARVGYQSPGHFSRDYRRFFGDAPMRHVASRRESVRGVSSSVTES